jgi:hypothetical protein
VKRKQRCKGLIKGVVAIIAFAQDAENECVEEGLDAQSNQGGAENDQAGVT